MALGTTPKDLSNSTKAICKAVESGWLNSGLSMLAGLVISSKPHVSLAYKLLMNFCEGEKRTENRPFVSEGTVYVVDLSQRGLVDGIRHELHAHVDVLRALAREDEAETDVGGGADAFESGEVEVRG